MVLNNLKKRFFQDIIYTNVGDILISINPFKQLPLYARARVHSHAYRPVSGMCDIPLERPRRRGHF